LTSDIAQAIRSIFSYHFASDPEAREDVLFLMCSRICDKSGICDYYYCCCCYCYCDDDSDWGRWELVKSADAAEKQGRAMLGLDERHVGRHAKDPMDSLSRVKESYTAGTW